jgi:hypothetical protein
MTYEKKNDPHINSSAHLCNRAIVAGAKSAGDGTPKA